MRPTLVVAAAISLSGISSAQAQRPFRLGATYSSPSLQDLSGATHSFSSLGGSIAFMTGDEGETGVTISRYHDLSTDGRARQLTLFGLDSYYYPVGARGVVAPFAGTALGLARVTEAKPGCLLLCGDTVSTTSQLALAFGLGVRVNVGDAAVATVLGRFLQVPGSDIQALELVATASVALGKLRRGAFLEGTLGPSVSALIPVSGSLRGRGPFAGVRFRRDTKKAGTVGLEIDYAPLEVTAGSWRLYAVAGLLLAGVYSQGPDRGIAQGAHGGVGADFVGARLMWNVNGRLLWLQRNSGENVLGVQVGVGLSPRIGGPGAAH